MIEAFAVADVVAAERRLMAQLDPTPTPDGDGELMARAVAGLTAVVEARCRDLGARRIVALVGPGNNGADALYAAARLARSGFTVAALHSEVVHEGARAAALAAGVALFPPLFTADPVVHPSEGNNGVDVVAEADVILDGILGIGGRAGLPAFAGPWVAAIPDTAYVIAVDLPSGQDPAGERLDPDGVFADETVTFAVAKPVHLLPPTEQAVGLLTVVDIGLTVESDPVLTRLTRGDIADRWPRPLPGDDKYSRGVVGIVAGSERYPGAAVLAVTAAAEAGAGMIRYAGPPTPAGLVRAAVPEALHGSGRVQAWVIGPGLDPEDASAEGASQVAAAHGALASSLPVIVDAGALDLVNGPRAAPTLLTPHAGECARLLTRLTGQTVTREQVTAAPLVHARALAERAAATVLLKGSTTLVVPASGGPVWAQNDAPAWLATAGAGDVLAGLLGVLAAAGMDLPEAAALAALVHGVAADRANPGGPVRALAVARSLGPTIADLLRTHAGTWPPARSHT